jgi:imidazolonepropionase-like amidohydrolase
MAALVSATSLSAESLGLGNTTGSIAPGFEADIIAFEGNPLHDVTAARRVLFVMKSGRIFVNRLPESAANPAR